MPSSYTASLRFELQFTGENVNLWGDKLNAALSRADTSVAGWLTKALTGNYTLTTANGTADEARTAMLKFTGTGAFTVTIPSVSKRYDVWNACTDVLTLTNGSASVTVQVGEVVSVVTDGGSGLKRVQPTDFGSSRITSVGTPTSNTDAATKKYVDDTAFAGMSGTFPGQGGNAGKFTTTDGSVVSWGYAVTIGAGLASVSNATLTVTAAAASDVRGGSDTSKALTAGALMASSAFQTLTDASTIAWNCANGYNATVTLAASGHTIGAPTGLYDGLSVSLEIVQDATGSRTVSWASIWDFGQAGAPVLQTTANKADRVFGQYNARTSKIEASFRKGA